MLLIHPFTHALRLADLLATNQLDLGIFKTKTDGLVQVHIQVSFMASRLSFYSTVFLITGIQF